MVLHSRLLRLHELHLGRAPKASQQKGADLNPLLAQMKENLASRGDVFIPIKEEGAASPANNQGAAFGGVLDPLGGKGLTTAHGIGGCGEGGGVEIPTGGANGNYPNGTPEPKAMFEKPKLHPPDSFDPSCKADPSIGLWEMERYMTRQLNR